MKKLLAIALLAATANVATADQDIGCGLGSMIMAGQSGPIFKVLGATTNGTFGNQTFGITTGTLGRCWPELATASPFASGPDAFAPESCAAGEQAASKALATSATKDGLIQSLRSGKSPGSECTQARAVPIS